MILIVSLYASGFIEPSASIRPLTSAATVVWSSPARKSLGPGCAATNGFDGRFGRRALA